MNILSKGLTLFPRYGNVLGGTLVQVFGPCFDEFSNSNITCLFGGIKVPGIYVNEKTIVCVSPASTTYGRVDFALNISNATTVFKKATFYYCKHYHVSVVSYKKGKLHVCNLHTYINTHIFFNISYNIFESIRINKATYVKFTNIYFASSTPSLTFNCS